MQQFRRQYIIASLAFGILSTTWYVQSKVVGADPAPTDPAIMEANPVEGPSISNDARLEIEAQYAEQNSAYPESPTQIRDASNGAVSAGNQTMQADATPEIQPLPDGGGEEEGPRAPILASRRLSYQAVLTDNLGNALPGPTVNLAFRIYSAAAVLVEGPINVPNVPIDDGVVSTSFPVLAGTFDGADRLVGVSVNGGGELSPAFSSPRLLMRFVSIAWPSG
ncbi:MAG: hypothetical protein IPK83_14590 [Planctomycetes bacterium]|nr:hypothetical protein [Planctomycetota bacterium]